MPLTTKERKILSSMQKKYGTKKGKEVFYASVNKGKFGKSAKARHKSRKKGK